jgi:hypothetical protein
MYTTATGTAWWKIHAGRKFGRRRHDIRGQAGLSQRPRPLVLQYWKTIPGGKELHARAESRTTPSEQVNTQEKGGREQQARAESKTTPSEQDLPHVVNKKNGCVVVVVCRGWFVGVR